MKEFGMRKIYYGLTCLLVIGVFGLWACSAKPQTVESTGYETPEKAVEAYLDGMKNMDIEQMTGAFAVECYVDNYDFKSNMERTGVYNLRQEIKFPNVDTVTRELNIETRRASILDVIAIQYAVIASQSVEMFEIKSEGEVDEFVENLTEQLNSVKTETIKLIGFIPPEKLSETYVWEAYQKNIKTIADVYGADKIECRMAVFECSGETYILFLDVASYGGKWYIQQVNGSIGALINSPSHAGGIFHIPNGASDEEWESLIVPIS